MRHVHGLDQELDKATKMIRSANTAKIFYHRDADGLCGAAIVKKILRSLGVECRIGAYLPGDLRKATPIEGLNIFVDLGAGQFSELARSFEGKDTLVIDHHSPQGQAWKGVVQVNPHKFGLDGSREISGAGVAYLISKAIKSDTAMAPIAVVGAIADRQNLLGELEGLNKEILDDGIAGGLVREEKDVLLFGRESRPLHIALKSFQDPPIPGVSGSEGGAMQLLSDLGIPLKDGKALRTLGDLGQDERRRLASELVVRCITRTSPNVARYVPKLIIGSVYRIVGEHPPLQYASEYATCINSAARMGLASEAIDVMLGDRSKRYRRVISGLMEYRRVISKEVRRVSMGGLESGRRGYLQYFISDETPRNFVGPVTGLMLGGGLADPYKPLVGIARGDKTKASARCSKILVLEGVDLSKSVAQAAEHVGGRGGGHPGAAGAFFKGGIEPKFIEFLERDLLTQAKATGSQSDP